MPELKPEAVIAAITNQRNNALNETVRVSALLTDAMAEIEDLKEKLSTAQLEASGLKLVDPSEPDTEATTKTTAS